MGDIGFGEMFIIILAIIVLFGPNKLPQIARDLGQGVRKMRGAVEDIKTEILKETDNPVSEIKKEIQKVKDAAQQHNPDHHIRKELEEISAYTRKPLEEQLKDEHQGPVSR